MHDVLRARGAVIVAIVMIMGIPVSLVLDSPSPATAAPGIKDLGNGNKTVTWNFSTPSDYVQSNISLAGGDARLDTSNLQLVHTTDADFINNAQSYDTANLTISNGSISTIEKRKELVVGGDFGVAGPWRYSGDGNSSAAWDAGNLTGKTSHARSNASMLQFDGMNTGLVANWTRVSGGVDPPIIRQAIEDTTWYHEFNASFRLTLDFMTSSTSWAGLERTGSWDWTSYNILSLWMDTNHSGMNGNLLVYVHIEAGALLWDSATKWVTPGWKRYDYDISTFPDLSGVTRLGFRITNVTTNTSVGVWLDDVWLYHFDDITSSASISQDVNKADFTPPTVGSVLLSFRYRVDSPVNLTSASLTAKIGSLWSSPPINATTATGWTPANFDVSSSLTAMGTFNLSLEANLHLFTPFATSLQIQIDDISLTVPDHHGGSYTSIPIGIGSSVFFDAASWLNSSHPDTTVTVDARTGHSPVIDSTWTSWAPATSIAGKIGSFVQYRIILSTSNSSASVSFHSLTIDDHKYFDGGSVKTVVFTPPDILIGWRFFNTTFTAPPATSISFFVSDDGGTIWSPVPPNSSISFLSGPNITVRANLSTTNMTVTPQVTTLEVTYEFRGTLDTIKVTPPWWNASVCSAGFPSRRA